MIDLLFYIKIKRVFTSLEPQPIKYLNDHQEYHISKNNINENDLCKITKSSINDKMFLYYIFKYFEYFNIDFIHKDYIKFLCKNRFNIYSIE